MSEIISEALVEERINLYVEENKEAILEMLDKKIETKIKESIREVFSYSNNWTKTAASKKIDEKIEKQISLQAENVSIDEEWIKAQVEKKVRTAVKSLTVRLG